MIKTIRHQPCPKAFTIIESLVVLVILTIITMVVLALLKLEMEPAKPTDKTSTIPRSAPVDPAPSATEDDQSE